MNRAFLTKLHLIAAAFMFPAVLMFLVTGALYTWGNKGEWHESTVEVALDAPLSSLDEAGMKAVVVQELESRDIALPSGAASVNGEGDDVSFSWTGARSDVSLAPTGDAGAAQLTINEASMHRWLVQLHKAKGSTFFKVYATLLAAVLFLLVVSGVIMGLQVKALRSMTIGASLAGLVAFVAFVLLG